MPYSMCPACGQHALKVANRCPRCGIPFEEQFLSRNQPPRRSRRVSVALLLASVLALLLATAEWIHRRNAAVLAGPAQDSTDQPIAAAPQVTPAPQLDSHAPVLRAVPAAPIDSPPAPAPAPALTTQQPRRPEPFVQSVPAALSGRRREARTWVNVRADPSSESQVLGILQPGEIVEVDSVAQGWALVHSDRLPTGYVDPRLLESPSPTPSP